MRRSIAVGAVVALVVLGAFSWLLVTRQPVTASSVTSPLLGKPAPTFDAKELTGVHSRSPPNGARSWC